MGKREEEDSERRRTFMCEGCAEKKFVPTEKHYPRRVISVSAYKAGKQPAESGRVAQGGRRKLVFSLEVVSQCVKRSDMEKIKGTIVLTNSETSEDAGHPPKSGREGGRPAA